MEFQKESTSIKPTKEPVMKTENEEAQKCHLCDKPFDSFELESHYLTHRGSKEVEKKFFCDFCEGQFNSKVSLNAHVRLVHKDYKLHKCEFCQKEFKTKSEFNLHIESHVDKDGREFPCDKCDKTFSTFYSGLQRHKRSIHNFREDRNIKCEFCDETYYSKLYLKKHISIVHEGIEKYLSVTGVKRALQTKRGF